MKILSRYAWVPAIIAALSISTYSLYYIARTWGLPPILAAGVSTVFDGSALTFADLALRYARTHGDSGFAPRLAVLTLASLSAYLNSYHAVLLHDPFPARVLYATPPVVSTVLFELSQRWERRNALRKAGRVPESIPPLGRLSFILFPVRSIKAIRDIVGFRLQQRVFAETNGRVTGNLAATGNPSGHVSTSAEVRTWARINGYRGADRGKVPAELVNAYRQEYGINGHEHAAMR